MVALPMVEAHQEVKEGPEGHHGAEPAEEPDLDRIALVLPDERVACYRRCFKLLYKLPKPGETVVSSFPWDQVRVEVLFWRHR